MRETISTDRAPAAIGPYSQAVRADGWVFASGQIPLDPATGQLVEGSIEEEATRTLDNLMAVLEAAGATAVGVVKATIYLTDMADFAAVNAVYARYFDDQPPARACVAVASLPKGVRIEIDAVARV